MRRVLSLLGLSCLGCLLLPWEDAIVYQSLDYLIDRPRILGIAVDPPAFREGRAVKLDALVLAPGGLAASEGEWKTCGLREPVPTDIWGLDCFSEEVDVEALATGIPATWTVPDLEVDCASDTGWTWCAHSLPFLLEARVGGETVRGTFTGEIPLGEDEGSLPTSWRTLPVALSFEEAEGVVSVEAWIGIELEYAVFRWYVDGGTLLDTGRTAAFGRRDGGTWSRNRWDAPNGDSRMAVVIASAGASAVWDTGPWETGAWETGAPWYASGWAETADMTWAVATWGGP